MKYPTKTRLAVALFVLSLGSGCMFKQTLPSASFVSKPLTQDVVAATTSANDQETSRVVPASGIMGSPRFATGNPRSCETSGFS